MTVAKLPAPIPRTPLPAGAASDLRPTLLDRLIERVAPRSAVARMQARGQLVLWRLRTGQYQGARSDRPNTRGWEPRAQSADDDARGDHESLRSRARAADRDMPLARSMTIAMETGVVGTGIVAFPRLDRTALGLTEEQADQKEREIRDAFNEWAESKWASADGTMTFAEMQLCAEIARFLSGDQFAVLRRRARPGAPDGEPAVQLLEADLVSTPSARQTDPLVVEGVEFVNGIATRIHVADRYPDTSRGTADTQWATLDIWRRDGRPNVLHIVGRRRAGQARGVTDLAPALESLKAISDLLENELTAALVASLFTVFMGSESGPPAVAPDTGVPLDADGNEILDVVPVGPGEEPRPRDVKQPPMKLGSGLVIYGLPGEKPEILESKRPNPDLAPFFTALAQVTSAATGLPYEVVMRRFTASYTASQGALIEAFRLYRQRRHTLVSQFCAPVREDVIGWMVATGRLDLPGFFTSTAIRRAWLACDWRGPTKGDLNPLQSAKAATERLANGMSTLEEECAERDGSSWEMKHPQRAKEMRMRVRDGLQAPVTVAGTDRVIGETAGVPIEAPPGSEPDNDDDMETDDA